MDQAARYSVQERIKIIEAYFGTKSVVQTQQLFQRAFQGETLQPDTMKCFLDKFRET